MKLAYILVSIRMQNGATEVARRVPGWEVPIIQAIHPETTIVRDDIVFDSGDEVPSVGMEMDRLKSAYGGEKVDGEFTGITYAESVFGKGALGLQSLKRAMQSCVLPASAEVTPEMASPPIRQDLLAAIHREVGGDDLVGDLAIYDKPAAIAEAASIQ
jgi:hypothetical protein